MTLAAAYSARVRPLCNSHRPISDPALTGSKKVGFCRFLSESNRPLSVSPCRQSAALSARRIPLTTSGTTLRQGMALASLLSLLSLLSFFAAFRLSETGFALP